MTETPDQSTSLGSWLAGMAIGAVAGLTLAILYAPRPGRETREELLQRLDELKTQLDETTKTLTELAKVRYVETKADLSQAMEVTRVTATERVAELRRQAGME